MRAVVVHPDDVNLADAKALAARHGTSVVGNEWVPRGQMFLCNVPDRPTEWGPATLPDTPTPDPDA